MRLPAERMLMRELRLLRRPARMPTPRLCSCSEMLLLQGRRLLCRKQRLLLLLHLVGRRRLRCKGG